MVDYDRNIYYNPDKCGLERVGELEDKNRSYEFDILLVVIDRNGNLYFAQDSGCSCPTPFESFYFNDKKSHNLTPIKKHTLRVFREAVKGCQYASYDERAAMIEKVESLLKKKKGRN